MRCVSRGRVVAAGRSSTLRSGLSDPPDALESNPTNPVSQLVTQYKERPGTIRSWLQHAEDEGLLDRSDIGPGVAGGRLTERCLQVLAEG